MGSEANEPSRQLPVAHGEELVPGVTLTRLEPGAQNGPDDIVLSDVVGGLTWQDLWYLGSDDDSFRMCIPDIRMPANQIWPLHWHDDWMFIVVLSGSVLAGDWHMRPGDVLVTEPNVEYGPLLNGPHGCQLLEVFSRNSKGGGYAPEYHDHPTLVGPGRVKYRPGIYKYGPAGVFNFVPRSPAAKRNEGNQTMKIDETPGLRKGHLAGGERWELGYGSDPERGLALATDLAPGEGITPHRIGDWRWTLLLEGDLTIGARRLTAGDILITEPGFTVPGIVAGGQGTRLLELCRTVAGDPRVPA